MRRRGEGRGAYGAESSTSTASGAKEAAKVPAAGWERTGGGGWKTHCAGEGERGERGEEGGREAGGRTLGAHGLCPRDPAGGRRRKHEMQQCKEPDGAAAPTAVGP